MNKLYLHTTDIHNTLAAKELIPYLLKYIKPKSVLDVGMGIGTWLKVFQDYGIHQITGVDGEYVDRSLFLIKEKNFIAHDLRVELNLKNKFDLVLSLEVIEHIPPEYEDAFIKTLTNHSDTILFSAAIPGQGGQNHLNEQWQSYWGGKFMKFGYLAYDIFRPHLWNNEKIEWWYRQNILLYSKIDLGIVSTNEVNNYVSLELYNKKLQEIKLLFDKNNESESLYNALKEGKAGIKEPLKALMKAIYKRLFS